MNIEEDEFLWLDEARTSKEWPGSIIIRGISLPGVSAPTAPDLNAEVPVSFDTRNKRDTISTTAVYRLTGIPKRNLDAWANSPYAPEVSVSWTFPHQEAPAFTFLLCLVTDNNPAACSTGSIVFARDLKSEWQIANSVQQTTAIRASTDSYTIYSLQQEQVHHQRTNTSRLPYCATYESRSKRRRTTVADHQCGPVAASAGNWSGAASARPSTTWDMAQGVSHSILESARRHANEAYRNSGSTRELRSAAELSQRLLAGRLHRQQGSS